jgi:hypothetical protein
MESNSETNWAKLDAMTESEIDTSDIPPLTEEFFNKSCWWKPKAIKFADSSRSSSNSIISVIR